MPAMANLLANALAIVTVVLIGAALLSMASRNLLLAGLYFLIASLVIYFRETRAVE